MSRTQRLFQEVLRGVKLEGQNSEVWKKQERKRGLGAPGGQDFGKSPEFGRVVQKQQRLPGRQGQERAQW